MHVCVDALTRAYLNTWMLGSEDACVRGFVGTRMRDCVDAWVLALLGVLMRGCLDVCIHVCRHEYMRVYPDARMLGLLDV